MLKVKRDEHWVAEIQMFPGDRLMRRVIYIYKVTKDGDVGFILIGDENVYYSSQVQWFNPVSRLAVNEDAV